MNVSKICSVILIHQMEMMIPLQKEKMKKWEMKDSEEAKEEDHQEDNKEEEDTDLLFKIFLKIAAN